MGAEVSTIELIVRFFYVMVVGVGALVYLVYFFYTVWKTSNDLKQQMSRIETKLGRMLK